MSLNYRLILASKSPRRHALLKSLGFDFEIRSKDVDESFPAEMDVKTVAQYLAEKKSRAFGALARKELLITSDTTVVLDNSILNKPVDDQEASDMLNSLSGHWHEVITGVCLRATEKTISFAETTRVYFRELTESEIQHYVVTHQPMDKAGAYGIQEWIGMMGIEKIEGDYYNVMGLPTHQLYRQLHQHFL